MSLSFRPSRHLHRIQRAQAQPHVAYLGALILQHQHAGLIATGRAAQSGLGQHQGALASGGLHLHRQGHVFAQKSRGLLDGELHLNGAALRIHRRRDGQHTGRKALPRKGIGHHPGRLAQLQLLQKTFIHLGHQLRGPGQRQAEQGLARLHDLPRLHLTHQHACIGGGHQRGLGQAGLGSHRGRLGQRPLGLGLGHVGTRIGSGLQLRLRAELLRPRHVHRPARLVKLRRAVKPLGHQLLHPRPVGAGGLQRGIGLRPGCLGGSATRAAKAVQPRLRLAFCSHSLGQSGAQLVGFELHQHIALAHLCALHHANLGHTAGDGAAHIHPRQRGHTR